jgi:hypothetical protein
LAPRASAGKLRDDLPLTKLHEWEGGKMNDNPNVAIAIQYFEALNRKEPHAAPLAPDVVMESPITPKLRGLASVLEYLEALVSVARRIRTLDFIVDGNKIAVQLEIETAAGVVPAFECLEISGGLIKKVRPYYLDARPLLDGPAQNAGS